MTLLRPFLIAAVIMGSAVLFALTLLPSVASAGHAVKRFSDQFNEIGKVDDVTFPRFPERSTIYAADGSVLATLFFDENRKYVKLAEIGEIAQKAVLAIEDTKFHEHEGVDTLAVLRAAIANFTSGEVEQGASTITQQLARNAFPNIGTERTIERKIIEARVALRIEQEYDKKQILELYLNRVYFGRGVYGIGTAAEYYFGKSAKDLNLGEAATLAGVIAAPEKYSPETNPEAATNRRNQVLQRMAAIGWITEEEAEQTMAAPIALKLTPPSKVRAPFFVDFIKRRILEDARFGQTREARKQTLFQGGLKIHTTLEPKLERHGKQVVKKHLPLGEDPEAAIASIEARTGAIKALVSSQSFDKSQVNLATGEGGTGRQIGSSFKPITLVAAFEQGIPQMKVYNGASGQTVEGCGAYRVNNADGRGGYMNLWRATENSVNAVFVRLSVDAGLEKVVEVAHRMGIDSKLEPFCGLTLGVF
ncbi:MAG TPA: transglycosylase domain-containing protein, partial [Actinomycetota bacterium]|nr:transglycosylase domain-containing protein [Actinomycetota bacterium]